MRKQIQSNKSLITNPEQSFQEYSFSPKDANKQNMIKYFKDYEKKVINTLEKAKDPSFETIGITILFCNDENIMLLKESEKSYEEVVETLLSNTQYKRFFYSDSNEVRKIACEMAFHSAIAKAKKGNAQSFVVFDVTKSSKLVCRGGVSIAVDNNETNINVFVNTKLCENFESLNKNDNSASFK